MASNIEKWSPNISDKVFIVTGGAAGVGAQVVRGLLTENARYVVFLDIAEREGTMFEAELLKFGALRAKFLKCDISDEEQLADAFRQVFDKYRRLDAVINNAAVLSAEDRTFKKMVDINFTATVNSTLKALDVMSAEKGGNGGSVLNVSSMLALEHNSHLPVYAATKTAVLQFSKAIGAEEYYSKTKVRVMTVCLGPTDTAILHRQNLQNFNKDCVQSLTSRVSERQRVDSAAKGILDVIKLGESGSTWRIENNQPAKDITKNIRETYEFLHRSVHTE